VRREELEEERALWGVKPAPVTPFREYSKEGLSIKSAANGVSGFFFALISVDNVTILFLKYFRIM
jgi:hypothetical protein